jgi:hypothetical protein
MTAQTLGIRVAGAALFAGAAAWTLQQQAGYVAVSWVCGSSATVPVWMLTALAIALLAIGGWVSWQALRPLLGNALVEGSDVLRPRRFLSVVALMAALLFFFTILLQAGAALFLPGCIG